MIRILLVEDEEAKRRAIANVLATCGCDVEVEYGIDVVTAKRALKEHGFDLLLLDINLPRRSELGPEKDGGLELLRWLKASGKRYRPPYIVGMTAYDSSYDVANSEFSNAMWSLIKFRPDLSNWKDRLTETISILRDQISPPYASDGRTYRTDFGFIAALRTPELDALLEQLTGWRKVDVPHDASEYHTCAPTYSGRSYSVVATSASDKGMAGAAIAATKLIYTFRPRYLIMIGICAGIKKRTGIGDVLVADPTWDWGSGKAKRVRGGKEVFLPAPYQMRVDETVKNVALSALSSDTWEQAAWEEFRGEKPKAAFKVKFGAMAAGGTVLQSSEAVQKIIDQHKDLIGIEMESFSVMYAAHVPPLPRPKSIIIKSVCDFGDTKKNDQYQPYAAYTSVKAALRFVQHIASSESGS